MSEEKLLNGFEKAKEKYKKAKGIANPEYLMSRKALYCPKCGYYFFLSGMGEYRCPQCGNEDKMIELFPKERTSDENLRAEVCHICFDVPNDEKNPKILRLIKKIQKESGRDRALVLFALAQNKINELEKKIKDLEEEIKGANRYIRDLGCGNV